MARNIPVASTPEAVFGFTEEVIRGEIPGFQIKDLMLDDAREAVVSGVRPFVPAFNLDYEDHAIVTRDLGMHVDSRADYPNPILALHYNQQGPDSMVILHSAKWGTTETQTGLGARFINRRAMIGPRYVGPLVAGTMTVFSESATLEDKGIYTGPAFHHFKYKAGSEGRVIVRYTWDITNKLPNRYKYASITDNAI